MGAIGGLLGFSGGAGGSGFGGPGASSQGVAPIVNPTSQEQINGAYLGANNAMNSQQNLLNALQQQNGLSNQTQVYNQLQGVANGTGPNPAQAQYQQNIQNLAQQQAGALASAKGISPALQARLVSQQGSAAMQNAAGQGATNLANQQLNAINAAGVMAGQQASNQIGQTNANVQAQQAEQNALLGAQGNANSANAGLQGNINSTNAGLAQTQMQGQQGIIGNLMNSAGLGAKLFTGANGGQVPKMAEGGGINDFAGPSGPQSRFGQFLLSQNHINGAPQQMDAPVFAPAVSSVSGGIGGSLKNKKKPQALEEQEDNSALSGNYVPGGTEIYSSPNYGSSLMDMQNDGSSYLNTGFASGLMNSPTAMARGGSAHDYRVGGNVVAKNPKEKAVKAGNSYANDKIPAVLSEGEVVIPRNVMQGSDPVRGAAEFVQAVLAKKRAKK